MAVENGTGPSTVPGSETESSPSHPNGPDGVSPAEMPSAYGNRDELVSLRVVTGSKTIFLRLCENDRGRFLKIMDKGKKLTVSGSGIPDLRASIDGLNEALDRLPKSSTTTAPESDAPVTRQAHSELLHAERFIAEGRKFYLDLLENERGVFVKMSQATTHRTSIIFPSSALPFLRDGLSRLAQMAPDPVIIDPTSAGHTTRVVDRQTPIPSGGTVTIKAVQRELRMQGKRVVFESGANRRGSYLRITETSGASKMSVTIPHSTIPHVLKLLHEVEEAGDPLDDLRAAESTSAPERAPEQ